jgi:hypothetical protein
MPSSPCLDTRPSGPAERSAFSKGSEVSKIINPSKNAPLHPLQNALQPADVFQKALVPFPSSSTNSLGGMDLVETTVSVGGMYGRLDTTAPRPPGYTSPRKLNLNKLLADQFIRGIANIRLVTTQIDHIDAEHAHIRPRPRLPRLGGRMAAARKARRAPRAAAQELSGVFDGALAAVE